MMFRVFLIWIKKYIDYLYLHMYCNRKTYITNIRTHTQTDRYIWLSYLSVWCVCHTRLCGVNLKITDWIFMQNTYTYTLTQTHISINIPLCLYDIVENIGSNQTTWEFFKENTGWFPWIITGFTGLHYSQYVFMP